MFAPPENELKSVQVLSWKNIPVFEFRIFLSAGKLTSEQIRAGYMALKKIEECLKKKGSSRDLLEACNQFYTRIPHDFGLKTPPVIRTEEELKEKISLLEALSEIQIAVKMVQSSGDSDEHPVDRQYSSLQCQLQPLDSGTNEFQVVEKYLQSTHATTHNDYTMTVLDIFSVDRAGETSNFLSQMHNRSLLCPFLTWEGDEGQWEPYSSSRCALLDSAVSSGETSVTLASKTPYEVDLKKMVQINPVTKYKRKIRSHPCVCVCVCVCVQVALGDSNELVMADYEAQNLPAGKHSVKGLGQTGPDPKNAVTLDGMTVPMGPGGKTGASSDGRYHLLYNEFIVYNPAQTRMKYLLRIKFNYSSLW
ncbi:poly [ADP-ribose] polymerase 2-like [Notothenia coriiceps]|uniref:Poly [ADP-ribose] polymerase n=1 Tax=Notothenia coriiceps TaxID=8208 RepID=A0A6I9P414_9TELE|nr:PREDICTED: poly [ADP-ribose] polymerase 2-like [Notothenia coriiceps]